jgi:hypothetical protein
LYPAVQECWSDRVGSMCQGCACPGNSEAQHGGFRVSAECSVHQSSAGECVSASVEEETQFLGGFITSHPADFAMLDCFSLAW